MDRITNSIADGILFENTRLGGLDLKNRFLMSAAASWKSTESGDMGVGQDLIQYRSASGGPAQITGGGVSVHPSYRRFSI